MHSVYPIVPLSSKKYLFKAWFLRMKTHLRSGIATQSGLSDLLAARAGAGRIEKEKAYEKNPIPPAGRAAGGCAGRRPYPRAACPGPRGYDAYDQPFTGCASQPFANAASQPLAVPNAASHTHTHTHAGGYFLPYD